MFLKSKDFFRHIRALFRYGHTQPDIVPKAGDNPTKKGYGVPTKVVKARRKALRLQQKRARRARRRS